MVLKIQNLRILILVSLLFLFTISFIKGQRINNDFCVDKLCYIVTSVSPLEVMVWNIKNVKIENVVIPETVNYKGKKYMVTSIGDGAFYECFSLNSVTIPNSIRSIGGGAFFGCKNLSSIFIKINNIQKVKKGIYIFKGVNKKKCILFVPKGKLHIYQNISQLKDFKTIKE